MKERYLIIGIEEREINETTSRFELDAAIDAANEMLRKQMTKNGIDPDSEDTMDDYNIEWSLANETTMQARSNYEPNYDVYIIDTEAAS